MTTRCLPALDTVHMFTVALTFADWASVHGWVSFLLLIKSGEKATSRYVNVRTAANPDVCFAAHQGVDGGSDLPMARINNDGTVQFSSLVPRGYGRLGIAQFLCFSIQSLQFLRVENLYEQTYTRYICFVCSSTCIFCVLAILPVYHVCLSSSMYSYHILRICILRICILRSIHIFLTGWKYRVALCPQPIKKCINCSTAVEYEQQYV